VEGILQMKNPGFIKLIIKPLKSLIAMLRIMLFFTLFLFAFGWVAGMTAYKLLQIIFSVVAIIIMLLVGNIILGLATGTSR
jgi:hypothetical protein